jgi:hypothetical protein
MRVERLYGLITLEKLFVTVCPTIEAVTLPISRLPAVPLGREPEQMAELFA